MLVEHSRLQTQATLQDVIDDINATFAGITGVNPESDNTGITIEYDSVADKFYLDTNALSPLASENIPVLGSTTDTSNFLKAVGLLDMNLEYRNADFESLATISLFNPGDGAKSWLHENDQLLSDELQLTSFNNIIYKRVKVEGDFSESSQYVTGEKVYQDGFVCEAKADLQAANRNGSEDNSGDPGFHNNQFLRLLSTPIQAKLMTFHRSILETI